jgi:DNA-binding response OmpR family regulator
LINNFPLKANNKKVKILLVEDDPNLSLVIQDYLEMLDYHTVLCKDGEEGMKQYRKSHFDLAILDIMMPKKDGMTLAQEIREDDDLIPIIFLTAKSLKDDRIKGFQAGCDDYITKPFSTEELSLRIKAILKRCQTVPKEPLTDEEKIYSLGKFTFDTVNMILSRNGKEQTLTRKECALLKLL